MESTGCEVIKDVFSFPIIMTSEQAGKPKRFLVCLASILSYFLPKLKSKISFGILRFQSCQLNKKHFPIVSTQYNSLCQAILPHAIKIGWSKKNFEK